MCDGGLVLAWGSMVYCQYEAEQDARNARSALRHARETPGLGYER